MGLPARWLGCAVASAKERAPPHDGDHDCPARQPTKKKEYYTIHPRHRWHEGAEDLGDLYDGDEAQNDKPQGRRAGEGLAGGRILPGRRLIGLGCVDIAVLGRHWTSSFSSDRLRFAGPKSGTVDQLGDVEPAVAHAVAHDRKARNALNSGQLGSHRPLHSRAARAPSRSPDAHERTGTTEPVWGFTESRPEPHGL